MIGDVVRLARAGFAFARHGVFAAFAPADMPPYQQWGLRIFEKLAGRKQDEADLVRRLSDALTELGPSYVKLGQFLATRPDVIGPSLAADLSRLQDRMAPFPHEQAEQQIRTALGGEVSDHFDAVEPCVAAASIAQVHPAWRIDEAGERRKIAVKILRPGIAARFHRDLSAFYLAARMMERFSAEGRRLRPIAVVDTLAASIALEMDLRMEAAAICEMRDNVSDDQSFKVPAVYWPGCTKQTLTLDWVDATKMNDIDQLQADGHDLVALAEKLIQSFLRHAVRDGFFHADMHPGNLFVNAAGDIVAVDFGIMGRLDAKGQRFLAEILYGFIRRDYMRVAQVHFDAGFVPTRYQVADFAQALRAIGEPLMDRRAEEISMGRLLAQLFEVTALFDMPTQPQLVLLQKTMVVVEGVARTLNPQLNMWVVAEPVVRDWIEHNLGPEGRFLDAAESAASLGRLFNQIPEMVNRVEPIMGELSKMVEHGVKLDPASVDAFARAENRHKWSTKLALWVGAISLATLALANLG